MPVFQHIRISLWKRISSGESFAWLLCAAGSMSQPYAEIEKLVSNKEQGRLFAVAKGTAGF